MREETKMEEEKVAGATAVKKRKIIMYFHGNAEDVTMLNDYHFPGLKRGHGRMTFLELFSEYLGCDMLAMEYPGYGFFNREIKGG